MANSNTTLAGVRRLAGPSVAGTSWRDHGQGLTALVAGAFTLAQLLLVGPRMGLGWDETVYASQISAHAPAAYFSAPRARGISFLVAPVTSWSSSTALLRVYLAVLSGAALFLALRTWRGLFPARVLALGGALFASLWVTLFYGPQVMPNYWVAIGALAVTGCFLRAHADDADRPALWGVALSAALMTWMRPTDAVWTAAPLVFLLIFLPRWRRLPLLSALVGGLAAGAVQWVAEAFASYGGLLQRLSDGSRIQGGLGWHIAVGDQLRSLGGRTLCRPCTGPMPNPAVTAWWFVLPLLVLVAAAVAFQVRRPAPPSRTLVPLACAATAAFPYLFLIGYAAPRFLLPAYALLAIPVADALLHVVTAPDGRRRPIIATLVAIGLAGHLAVQYAVLHRTVVRTDAARRDWSRTAAELHRLGVRPPCLLTGDQAVPIAFYTGCSSAATGGSNKNATAEGIARTARTMPVAHLDTPTGRPPSYARGWRPHSFHDVRIYVAPTATGNGRG
ncbi:hypothetical protein [Streptomyces chiangmaiensis]|uniref:Integral membrane protein n=1 Tax=Streptomyces chiangmaiensis TaxID=766497 RepID=A0ABU7FG69_9ACTN|nr:hypothetical protein [Streptomyces chiangmaiensis]MED7823131.1 hypothetical protein [Streptomyces chiangmaiensis]